MKLLLFLLFFCSGYAQETYKDGCTTYYKDRCYSSGANMVKRSNKNKTAFLKSKGLKKCPKEFEIDHIIPLSQGGSDCPENMQLLSVAEHRSKTAGEAKKRRKPKAN